MPRVTMFSLSWPMRIPTGHHSIHQRSWFPGEVKKVGFTERAFFVDVRVDVNTKTSASVRFDPDTNTATITLHAKLGRLTDDAPQTRRLLVGLPKNMPLNARHTVVVRDGGGKPLRRALTACRRSDR